MQVTLRSVDIASYEERLKTHDFDITTLRYVFSLSPGVELTTSFASATADQVGSSNAAGIKDPVVDALIGEVAAASDRATLIAAARALDRVLLWGHYMIPQWYKGAHHLVYWNKFGRPALKPRYARGVIDTWWVDREKDDALKAYRDGKSCGPGTPPGETARLARRRAPRPAGSFRESADAHEEGAPCLVTRSRCFYPRTRLPHHVMAGLVPAIHAFAHAPTEEAEHHGRPEQVRA